MNRMRRAWARLPPAARWPLVWLGLLVGSGGLGRLIGIGAGNGIFLAGVGAILLSLNDIRLGGERTRFGRDIAGKPLWGIDPLKRHAEMRRGVSLFLVGLALWAVLGGAILLHITL